MDPGRKDSLLNHSTPSTLLNIQIRPKDSTPFSTRTNSPTVVFSTSHYDSFLKNVHVP